MIATIRKKYMNKEDEAKKLLSKQVKFLNERDIANKTFAEYEGMTQNEYEAMRLVTYNAYRAPQL